MYVKLGWRVEETLPDCFVLELFFFWRGPKIRKEVGVGLSCRVHSLFIEESFFPFVRFSLGGGGGSGDDGSGGGVTSLNKTKELQVLSHSMFHVRLPTSEFIPAKKNWWVTYSSLEVGGRWPDY